MQTRQPKVCIINQLLYEISNKNAQLCHCGRHRKGGLTNHHIFEDFQPDEPIFVLFQISHTNILMRLE